MHVPTSGGLPHLRTSMEANVTNKMEENAGVTRRQRFVRLANKRVVKANLAPELQRDRLGVGLEEDFALLVAHQTPRSTGPVIISRRKW